MAYVTHDGNLYHLFIRWCKVFFFLFWLVDCTDLSKSTFEMHCRMLCHSFSSALKNISWSASLQKKGYHFYFRKQSTAKHYVTGKPLQYTWWPCSVRWNSVQDTHTLTRFISLESRAKSETGESSHPQERERGGRMTSSMTKAAERGSSKSADLIGEHWR